MKHVKGLAALFLVAALIGCGKAEENAEMPAPEEAAVTAEQPETTAEQIDIPTVQAVDTALTEGPGKQVYAENCIACHEGQVPKAPHRSMLNIMSPESVYRALTEGVMQDQSAHMSDSDKRHVAEYVTGRAMGAGPKDDVVMCEGDPAEAFDREAVPYGSNWGLKPDNSRRISSEFAGFGKDDLPKLELKWAFAYPEAVRARSQPTIAGGAVYVGSHNGTVFALDAKTGCVRWQFHASAEVRTGIAIDMWEAGDETASPQIYFGDLLGNLYSLDAITGSLVWRQRPDDHPNATITATPSLHDGKLYSTVSSLEVTPAGSPFYECCSFRGSVVAYDAKSGERLWQTYTIEEEPAFTQNNAAGTPNFGPSGAPSWNSPVIDAKRNQLYFGTGENYSSPATLTSDAIFAVDLTSGKVNWVYQATANDAWNQACRTATPENCPKEDGPDVDFGAAAMLVAVGDGTDVVVGGQKSGLVVALDPDTGEVVWKNKVGRGGIQGGIHFGMAADEGVVYVPISDMVVALTAEVDKLHYPGDPKPGLYALNAATGDYLWKATAIDICEGREYCNPGTSAAITALPDLVMAGAMDGVLRIHDSATGEVLWSYDSTQTVKTVSGQMAHGGSFGGATAPVAAHGMLFANSGYGIYFHMPGNVLLAFGLKEE